MVTCYAPTSSEATGTTPEGSDLTRHRVSTNPELLGKAETKQANCVLPQGHSLEPERARSDHLHSKCGRQENPGLSLNLSIYQDCGSEFQ